MINTAHNRDTFVLFPLGKKRFALPAGQVSELARQDDPQTFPHTTPLLTGVVLRRDQIVPVADIAPILIGPEAPARKFFLIVNGRKNNKASRTAIPVTGECELAYADRLAVTGKLPAYVCGLLAFHDEIIEVLDLERLISVEVRA